MGVQALVMVPSIVYTGLVFLMSYYYRKLATCLTEWGNKYFVSMMLTWRETILCCFFSQKITELNRSLIGTGY
jgi:hypothetical protein